MTVGAASSAPRTRPTVAIIGAGDRGSRYARILTEQAWGTVVGVAEPVDERRLDLATGAAVPPDGQFLDWRDMLSRPRFADAIVVSTRDDRHHEPTIAALEAGYYVLVEKPMATTEDQATEMVRTAQRTGRILAVCHVLRYTAYTEALRELIDAGTIGDIVSVEHLEPVGWWHHAHSYVRGNWRRADESTFMLMAKSVHDIDWLSSIVGRQAVRVSSFGSLQHFRPENRPAGAADRCLDCAVEPSCPYSAPRLYLSCLKEHQPNRWPLSVVTSARTADGVLTALRGGPYGRCVYDCDNDVVDHQVVSIEYQGGATAAFTMIAFSPHMFRRTRIFGSQGYLEGDGVSIRVTDFRHGEEHRIDLAAAGGPGADDGHGGGDEGLIRAFTEAIRSGDPERYLTPVSDSLDSHRLTWAAERARLTRTVIELGSQQLGSPSRSDQPVTTPSPPR